MIKVFFAAACAFLVFLLIHFGIFYYFPPYEKVKSIFLCAAIGFFLLLFFLSYLPEDLWFQEKLHISKKYYKYLIYPAFGGLFYGFLILGYLEFYFTADRSITFRMLLIADKQLNQGITKEKMNELYDVPGILERRFEDLTYGGYFELQNGGVYQLTSKGKLILAVYKAAIEGLNLDTGELKDVKEKKNE